MAIHPTAIVHPGAELGPDAEVGPYAVIEPGTVLGARTKIHAHAFVGRGTTMGEGNEIHSGAIVGNAPQDKKYLGEPSRLEIGDRNVFRESCQIHRGSTEGSATKIGDDNLFMALSHVAHDCTIGNGAILGNASMLAGHVTLEDRATISAVVAVHQFVNIGTLCMIGGFSAVPRDIPPYFLAVGQRPCRVYGPNTIGLRRAGIPPERRNAIREAYRTLYRSGFTIPEALARLEEIGDAPEVAHLIAFVRSSRRGIETGAPAKKSAREAFPEAEGAPD